MERTFTIAPGEQISVFVEGGTRALFNFMGGQAAVMESHLPSDGSAPVERWPSFVEAGETFGCAPGGLGGMLTITSDDGVTVHAGGIGGYIADVPGGV